MWDVIRKFVRFVWVRKATIISKNYIKIDVNVNDSFTSYELGLQIQEPSGRNILGNAQSLYKYVLIKKKKDIELVSALLDYIEIVVERTTSRVTKLCL